MYFNLSKELEVVLLLLVEYILGKYLKFYISIDLLYFYLWMHHLFF